MIGASSNHAGGVNVGFLDGSVKFISDRINPATWRAWRPTEGEFVPVAHELLRNTNGPVPGTSNHRGGIPLPPGEGG